MYILDVISSVSRFSKCTKIVGGWGFDLDLTGEAYSAFPTGLIAELRGPTSNAPTFKGSGVEGM